MLCALRLSGGTDSLVNLNRIYSKVALAAMFMDLILRPFAPRPA